MHIRTIAGTIASLILIGQPAAALALAGGPTLVAQQFESQVTAGGQFTVNVIMDTKTYQVSAAELHLTFPSDKLQALSIQPGSFLPNVLTAGSTGNGTASITVGSGTQPKQGTGTVAVIQFRALTAGSAQVAFASNTQVAASGQSGNVVDTMSPANITIAAAGTGGGGSGGGGGGGGGGAGTPTPGFGFTPTPTITFAPTPIPSSLIGAVGGVSTGPMETGLMALIVSAIAVLAYAGYTSSDEFRRREAQKIADDSQRNPPNLNR